MRLIEFIAAADASRLSLREKYSKVRLILKKTSKYFAMSMKIWVFRTNPI